MYDTTSAGDTLHLNGFVIEDPGVSLGKAILILPPTLQRELQFEAFRLTEVSPGAPPPFLQGSYGSKLDLLSPYLLQRESENRLSTLYLILGAAVGGGAAYIGYQHVKKYGF